MKKSSLTNFWIGSMLFGLFFGAGNLIFPVMVGQLAGSSSILASIGFILAATGIPFLGVIALAKTGSSGTFDFSSKVSRRFGFFFTIALYLTIGPFFAAPRLVGVPFEVGISSMVDPKYHTLALALFSFVFYGVALMVALKPSKIMDFIGKYLNPIFLVMLAYLIIKAIISPMGSMMSAPVSDAYSSGVFGPGFIEGYNTMDSLAALAFGSIVITNIKTHGISGKKDIIKNTAISGTVTVLLMAVIYFALTWLGATSLGIMDISPNGGIALSAISTHYLGVYGNLFFTAVVTIACLKTAIGLFSACSNAFVEMFPNSLNYKQYVFLFAGVTFLVSNLGLKTIVNLSIPVLMMLYPLAIVLILLAMFEHLFNGERIVYQITIGATMIAALGDFIHALPVEVKSLPVISQLNSIYAICIPFYESGFAWLLISAIGFCIGLIIYKRKEKHTAVSVLQTKD